MKEWEEVEWKVWMEEVESNFLKRKRQMEQVTKKVYWSFLSNEQSLLQRNQDALRCPTIDRIIKSLESLSK
jgi:hypothetical protein